MEGGQQGDQIAEDGEVVEVEEHLLGNIANREKADKKEIWQSKAMRPVHIVHRARAVIGMEEHEHNRIYLG